MYNIFQFNLLFISLFYIATISFNLFFNEILSFNQNIICITNHKKCVWIAEKLQRLVGWKRRSEAITVISSSRTKLSTLSDVIASKQYFIRNTLWLDRISCPEPVHMIVTIGFFRNQWGKVFGKSQKIHSK